MLIESVIFPTIGGINAPPETAIIIKPEISLARSAYLLTVKEKIKGNIFDDAKPIENMTANAIIGEGAIINKRIVTNVAMAEPIKNFFDENRVKSKAPANVPNIFPKK